MVRVWLATCGLANSLEINFSQIFLECMTGVYILTEALLAEHSHQLSSSREVGGWPIHVQGAPN